MNLSRYKAWFGPQHSDSMSRYSDLTGLLLWFSLKGVLPSDDDDSCFSSTIADALHQATVTPTMKRAPKLPGILFLKLFLSRIAASSSCLNRTFQTFPDMYLGKAILEATSSYESSIRYVSTTALSKTLKHWLEQEPEQNLVAPWRRSTDLWHILLGITLFEKLPDRQVRLIWSTFRSRWANAKGFLEDTHRVAAIRAMRQSKLLPTITAVASSLSKKNALDDLEIPEVGESQLEMALALADLSHQRPIFAPIYRVVERVFGDEDERSSIGHEQLMVARLVGVDQGGRAYAGVLEVADQFCKPGVPECTRCPLNKFCFTASKAYSPVSPRELAPTG